MKKPQIPVPVPEPVPLPVADTGPGGSTETVKQPGDAVG